MAGKQVGNPISPSTSQSSDLLRLLEPISADLVAVEQLLAAQVTEFEPAIRTQIQYLLTGSGKRLRPALTLLAGGATGGVNHHHVTMGVIMELIHLATLVHDDILDEAELRHNQATPNARWGNEISVLLGDCLFARALHLTAGYSTTDICRRVSAATGEVCAGEILQTQRRFDLDLTVPQYLDIIYKKTGALFAASCELGAILNDSPPVVVELLQRFGGRLGIAYQIFDDCIDIFGQESHAGKSLGTDVKKGKLTLPFLLLLNNAEGDRRRELGEMIFAGTPAARRELVGLAFQTGTVSESLLAIERHVAEAEACLSDLPGNSHTQTLSALVGFIATKSRLLLQQGVAA